MNLVLAPNIFVYKTMICVLPYNKRNMVSGPYLTLLEFPLNNFSWTAEENLDISGLCLYF